MQMQNTISVIICSYTEQRWEELLAAMRFGAQANPTCRRDHHSG